MTFEGATHAPEIVGENSLPGHHNYFLGNDESRWRTDVPLYASVRYEDLYPGTDLRVRRVNGVPEYDLLLAPRADLSNVVVRVEGARGLSVAEDGSLIIETELGPLTQPRPETWQVDADGQRRELVCGFVLRGTDRFGFAVPEWDSKARLTIDPALIWSTFLGASSLDRAEALFVDGSGVVTVAGEVTSKDFPTSSGAYNTTYNATSNGVDIFVSRLDPRKTGSAQLVYSTFLGGSAYDSAYGLSVDSSGRVAVSGNTTSGNFPTTSGAYDTIFNGSEDAFVTCLDPSRSGSSQLVCSTFLGGGKSDVALALTVDARGMVTVAGGTGSADFPTTRGAYDRTYNGGNFDAFVSHLDPSKTGVAQLVYSTFLGSSGDDSAGALSVDARGMMTVTGSTDATGFPTTNGAYDTTFNGGLDVFVSRLMPLNIGRAGLAYSTFLGGDATDVAYALSVDARGVVTVAGSTSPPTSTNFPTTSGAYDRTHNGKRDAFVSRLDPSKVAGAQLVYSTLLGQYEVDLAFDVVSDSSGVVTVAGQTISPNFPTTNNAYDSTWNGGYYEAFVSRLDSNRTGAGQLIYSTFLGGSKGSGATALHVDGSGVATVAGYTWSPNFPTTRGAYDTINTTDVDAFISRLDMGVAFYGDVHEVAISSGGTQAFTVNAGKAHATRSYWIFGSVSGTTPGVTLGSAIGSVYIPLNPDVWTDYTIGLANTTVLRNTRSTLDATGTAQATFNIPKANVPSAIGLVFHHAYLVYDQNNNFYLASNAVPLKLVQ